MKALIIPLTLALVGCATVITPEQEAEFQAAVRNCGNIETVPSVTAYVKCYERAEDNVFAKAHLSPDPQVRATRIMLAYQVDSGKMTREEGLARYEAFMLMRGDEKRQAQLQAQERASERLHAMSMAFQQQQHERQMMSQRQMQGSRSVTCQPWLNGMRCTEGL